MIVNWGTSISSKLAYSLSAYDYLPNIPISLVHVTITGKCEICSVMYWLQRDQELQAL